MAELQNKVEIHMKHIELFDSDDGKEFNVLTPDIQKRKHGMQILDV